MMQACRVGHVGFGKERLRARPQEVARLFRIGAASRATWARPGRRCPSVLRLRCWVPPCHWSAGSRPRPARNLERANRLAEPGHIRMGVDQR